MKNSWSRRSFLKFIGASSATLSTASVGISCSSLSKNSGSIKGLPLNTASDDVSLVKGLKYKLLIKEGDSIGKGINFGTNNDYTNLYKFSDGRFGLWVNHEDMNPLLAHGRKDMSKITTSQMNYERDQLGGSFFEVKENESGDWFVVKDSKLNFVLNGNSKIKMSDKVLGSATALGTFANCSGGYTPWGTILTCEENYDKFYGEAIYDKKGRRSIKTTKRDRGWKNLDPRPPEHYGWVVEVNPVTKTAEKIINLGRFAHECATVTLSKEGYPVVYSGDDSKNECLYKFVSNKKGSLKSGTLYVANLEQNKWLSLDYQSNPKLKRKFKSQTDVYIRAREAARIVGASLLDRPEDIEIDPITQSVFVSLTNNSSKNNYHGSILKITENNPSDLSFKHETFKAGGLQNGFSCPDNMAFDKNGNLWLTSDISGYAIGSSTYKGFGNNGLFLIPRTGPSAGDVIKVASSPNDAEFTGPFFSPDEKTLFLSVQHPGEMTKELGKYTSNWPLGGNEKPLSSVICISGDFLEQFTKQDELV